MLFIQTAHAQATRMAQEESISGVSQFWTDLLHAVPLWIAAVVVFIASFFIAAFIRKIVSFRLGNKDMNREVMILIERTVHTGILILGLIISFQIVGIDLGSLLAFLGVGIGFALKDLLSNFFAGVMILTQKKFKIGDVVQVGENTGTIVEIDARTTQIRAFDGTTLIIPNADMITNVVQNFTANTFRRVLFNVGVHYSTPLAESIQTAIESVKKNQQIVPEPAVQVLATEFGDSAINLEIRFWVESTANWLNIRSEVIQQLKLDFDAAKIEIPFPIQTLTLDDNDANLMRALHLPGKTA
ncbi:mechanosensitive ion channel [bacterium]|jgi:small conductance mechanosensitive channel|nr:mechanosensitive ion channel [bacterium]MBT7772492.1 mechanosensitive ion channel [bacterium]